MLTILLRTFIIYVVLIASMRIMGKRQIGELEVSDLVTTLLLSEIATLPIENPDVPLMYAIIPMITVLTIEVTLSVISRSFPRVAKILNSHPNMLICKGKIDERELERSRISIDELISEIRQSGYASIDEVQYAILEPGGKLTLIPKSRHRQVSLGDLGIDAEECGISHIIISNGKLNKFNLGFIGIDENWVSERLREARLCRKEVLLMTVDDSLGYCIIKKERKA